MADKLKAVAAKKGKSINQLTLDIIKEGLGCKKEKKYSWEYDDLDHLFGRWSEDEFKGIQEEINKAKQIDLELWK